MKLRIVVSTVLATVVAFALSGGVALAQDGGHMWDGDGHMWGWGGGWWIVMTVMMVLFWAAVIGVAVWAVSRLAGSRGEGRSALDIARERLAKGQISEEEFDRLRQKLG
ncbi:MAG: SHOCT domain-containing protein [Dehalococcoidia bacterium]